MFNMGVLGVEVALFCFGLVLWLMVLDVFLNSFVCVFFFFGYLCFVGCVLFGLFIFLFSIDCVFGVVFL